MPRIFDPFFTTRPAGDGLGLGLSICQRIVTDAGGEITVESQLGFGATFRVALPEAVRRERKASPRSVPPATTRRGRVLVVDDEEMVGRTIERLLARFHEVHLETDPQKALARVAAEGFDVVLCDITMPGMTGMEVHDRLQGVGAEIAKKVVFLTGGAVSFEIESFIASCPNLVLHKPFSAQQLLSAVGNFVR